MKSKLLSGVAIPALFAFTAATAFAAEPSATDTAPAPTEQSQPQAAPEATTPAAPEAMPAKPDATAPSPSASDSAAVEPSKEQGTYAAAQSADEWRSSKIVGMTVYNAANENIGDINDLLLSADGKVATAVIGVGGFLGMGEKLVGVPFGELKFDKDDKGKSRIVLNSSKEALESAPEFKYDTSSR